MMGGQTFVPLTGGSDDIADIAWSVPTIVLRYPSNIPEKIMADFKPKLKPFCHNPSKYRTYLEQLGIK